jgi:hypothetical protein
LQGRTEEAFDRARWAVWQGDHLNHLPSSAQALVYFCFLGVLERRPDVIDEHSDRLVAIADRISFPLLSAAGRFWAALGRALAGRPDEAIDGMVSSLDAWRRTGSHGYLPFASGCLAETLAALDRRADALEVIDGAVELAERSAELWCAPELDRVRAHLLFAEDAEEAERVLRRSLDLAGVQGARPWVLRTAGTLAEQVAASGRVDEALTILDGVSATEPGSGYDATRVAALGDVLRGQASATSTPR